MRQYFFQAVFHRAIHPDDDLPPLDSQISNYIKPEEKLFEDTQDLMKDIKKEFKFTKRQLSKEKVANKKETLMWQ